MTEKTKEQFINVLYKGLKKSYPDCKETIKESIEQFEKGEEPENIIWMWIEEDVKKYFKLTLSIGRIKKR